MAGESRGAPPGEAGLVVTELPGGALKVHLQAGVGAGELVFNGNGASVWDDEKFLEMDGGGGCIRV